MTFAVSYRMRLGIINVVMCNVCSACDAACSSGCNTQGAGKCDATCLITHKFNSGTYVCEGL